ncbi:MAG: DsbE family thiol:disulfide interchange protein [Betaproteobacteria bacterium]|nr:DsbE family thiol:disulfide interchange protein [Betaproteobacteria bacterium]
MTRFLVPLVIFIVMVAFLAVGLGLNPREVPSPLINKPAPAFQLPQLHQPDKTFSQQDMKGKVWLLNVWASWCVSCRQEHPVLMDLAKSNVVPIYGLNYKDPREDAIAWLKQLGDPYVLSIADRDGRVGIDFGVYGVPETFVIDKEGAIRYKQIGPVTPEALRDKILPLVKALPTVADPVTNKRAVNLAEQLRCLVCQNQSIADSNAELAVDLRRQINEQIAQGRSDGEIVDFMVQRYGEFVLYRPPFNAVTLLLWLGPALLLAAGLAVLIFNVRRRRAQRDEQPLTADQQKQAERLLAAGSDRERR